MASLVALIPARAGSQRVPGKNTKPLAGHPLLAYTIAAAQHSGVCDRVLVCADADALEAVAHHYGAGFIRRPASGPDEPDIAWVRQIGLDADAFAILRPTSPFRSATTIRAAWAQFRETRGRFDSLRAVTPWTGHHPGKMWTLTSTGLLTPIMRDWTRSAPYHSSPTQTLMPVFKQTASLEIAWRDVLSKYPPTISGTRIMPFFVEGAEAFDINTPDDWDRAEQMIAEGIWTLPPIGAAFSA